MKKKVGSWGEETASCYLKSHGYKIIKRNYYTRYGEIDIICEKKNTLVFVEVKTRRSLKYGSPEESITPKKIEHLKKAAYIYLNEINTYYKEIRFDVISIVIERDKKEISHIKNAF